MANNQVSFLSSENGISTCKVDNKYLHSRYNPQQEARRNFQTQLGSYKNIHSPAAILVVGGGLGYETNALESLYPDALVIPILFNAEIFVANNSKHKLLYSNACNFIDQMRKVLHNKMHATPSAGDILVLFWPPSSNIWPTLTAKCLKEVREALSLYYAEMHTVKYFLCQWIRNACFHYIHIDKYLLPHKSNNTVVIVGAGPDLNYQIDKLKASRNEYTLIGVSSALKCLFAHNLFPDIIVHQDSSYYASRYLIDFPANYTPIIALPLHASRSVIVRNYPCMVLNTSQEPEHLLKITDHKIKIPSNGTVFGTALELAWAISNNKVILAGFDLCVDVTGSHCFPHGSFSPSAESVLKPLETSLLQGYFDAPIRLAQTRYGMELRQSEALHIYSEWFLRWKHPSKLSRCLILSDISPPHLAEITRTHTITNTAPPQTQQSLNEQKPMPAYSASPLEYSYVAMGSRIDRTKNLVSLTEQWLYYWEEIHKHDTIPADKADANALVIDTLHSIKSNIDYQEFIALVHSIQSQCKSQLRS